MEASKDELENLREFSKPPGPMAETRAYADIVPKEINDIVPADNPEVMTLREVKFYLIFRESLESFWFVFNK